MDDRCTSGRLGGGSVLDATIPPNDGCEFAFESFALRKRDRLWRSKGEVVAGIITDKTNLQPDLGGALLAREEC